MMSALRFSVIMFIALIALFVYGCDFFDSIVDGNDEIKTDYIEIENIYPQTHINEGHSYNVVQGTRYLKIPGFVWPTSAVGPVLYVVSGLNIYPFQAVNYDIRDSGQSLAVNPVNWTGGAVYGTVFWNESNDILPYSIYMGEYSDSVVDKVLQAAANAWEIPDSLADSLDFVFLGSGEHLFRFWVSEEPDSVHGVFDPDGPVKRMGPVDYRDSEAELKVTFEVPCGPWLFTSNIADLNGDHIGDMFTTQLFGEDAPTYGFIRDSEGDWRFVLKYYP